MMFVPFELAHLNEVKYLPEFEGQDPGPMAQALAGHGRTMVKEGKVIMIGGAVPVGQGRFLCTILLAKEAGNHMREIVKYWRDFIDQLDYNRLEAVSLCDLPKAHKLVRMLGFECEAPRMRNFHAGQDYALFARTR
jgi:hypothetical protein